MLWCLFDDAMSFSFGNWMVIVAMFHVAVTGILCSVQTCAIWCWVVIIVRLAVRVELSINFVDDNKLNKLIMCPSLGYGSTLYERVWAIIQNVNRTSWFVFITKCFLWPLHSIEIGASVTFAEVILHIRKTDETCPCKKTHLLI